MCCLSGRSAKQDGPRPGGFPPIRYRRDMATRGPTGAAMFAAAAGVIMYGMYKVGQGNIARRLPAAHVPPRASHPTFTGSCVRRSYLHDEASSRSSRPKRIGGAWEFDPALYTPTMWIQVGRGEGSGDRAGGGGDERCAGMEG